MSREIKFRAWGVYGFSSKSKMHYFDIYEINNGYSPNSDVDLMQYIGLKDTNGKEIYEGDIIHHLRYGFNWEVVYSIENTGYDLKNDNHGSMHLCDKCQSNIEVIGNIYENKVLLKERL